jgi:hypothetical protein
MELGIWFLVWFVKRINFNFILVPILEIRHSFGLVLFYVEH